MDSRFYSIKGRGNDWRYNLNIETVNIFFSDLSKTEVFNYEVYKNNENLDIRQFIYKKPRKEDYYGIRNKLDDIEFLRPPYLYQGDPQWAQIIGRQDRETQATSTEAIGRGTDLTMERIRDLLAQLNNTTGGDNNS